MFQHVWRIVDGDTLDFRASGLKRPSQQHRAVQIGGHTNDMGKLAQLRVELAPVRDSLIRLLLQDHHVRRGAQQAALQRIAKSIVDGDADHQRGHTSHDAENGNDGDHRNHRLLAFGAQITAGDEKLERLHCTGRSSGNRMTSRMEREFVRIMVRRSIPMPSPPVGGRP